MSVSNFHTSLANQIHTLQADFFAGHNIGLISAPVKFRGASSCFADFGTHAQAIRATETMDGMPLHGRDVEIELAQETASIDEGTKHPSPVRAMASTRRTGRF
jgi:hypothetical protein